MKSLPGLDTKIHVVYPHTEQRIFDDSTFLMGQIQSMPSGAQLLINKQLVPLSRHGFFAWKVPIHAGMNPVQMEVRVSESTPPVSQNLFALYGVPPLAVLPASPLAVYEETLQPQSDVWLSENDVLTVSCSASEGAAVSLTIPGWLDEPIPVPPLQTTEPFLDTREMVFAQPHWTAQRIPTRGYYQAKIPVKTLLQQAGNRHPLPQGASIVLHFKHNHHMLEKKLPGKISLMTHPRTAVTTTDRLITRTIPPNGARLTPQRTHTRCLVDGLEQDWARVRLSPDEVFYVSMDALIFEKDTNEPPMTLAVISTHAISATDSQVRLAFAQNPASACPVQIESQPSERMDRLRVRLYGVCSQCDFIQYPPDDAVIRQIHWRQVAQNVLEVWIDLHRPLTGYDYSWQNGEWQIEVRTLPRQIHEISVLIDPGHGGSECGSTGLNGLPEKTLNLTVSRLLRDVLLKEGFKVALTRDSDQEVTLVGRGNQVIAKKPHLVLSLHHNALPDGRDPLAAKGACCFYYHAFSKPLAEQLLQGLTTPKPGMTDVPNYGLFYDSLYMTRIHQALAVLVEVGFFTNPDEFERLIQPAFQQQVAERLATALRGYVSGV